MRHRNQNGYRYIENPIQQWEDPEFNQYEIESQDEKNEPVVPDDEITDAHGMGGIEHYETSDDEDRWFSDAPYYTDRNPNRVVYQHADPYYDEPFRFRSREARNRYYDRSQTRDHDNRTRGYDWSRSHDRQGHRQYECNRPPPMRHNEYDRLPWERQERYNRKYGRIRQGEKYDCFSSSSDSSFEAPRKGRKIKSGINAKPTSSVWEQLRYPHFSLGQVSGFIGMNLQFHNLSYEQFVAGELETVLASNDDYEKTGRIELLHCIAQWQLRSNVPWPQIRNTYAHILRKIENREITWSADWDRFEKHIYDKISNAPAKETKQTAARAKNEKGDFVWFCKQFQKLEGCSRESPHPGRIGNTFRQMHHICASCWLRDKQKRPHPEISSECPHREI